MLDGQQVQKRCSGRGQFPLLRAGAHEGRRPVLAAVVHDKHTDVVGQSGRSGCPVTSLVAVPAQVPEQLVERRGKARFLVEGWEDDGQAAVRHFVTQVSSGLACLRRSHGSRSVGTPEDERLTRDLDPCVDRLRNVRWSRARVSAKEAGKNVHERRLIVDDPGLPRARTARRLAVRRSLSACAGSDSLQRAPDPWSEKTTTTARGSAPTIVSTSRTISASRKAIWPSSRSRVRWPPEVADLLASPYGSARPAQVDRRGRQRRRPAASAG